MNKKKLLAVAAVALVVLAYVPEVTLATINKVALWKKLKQYGIKESREDAARRLGASHGGNGRSFQVLGIDLPPNAPIGTWSNRLVLGMIEGDGTNWPVHLTDDYGFFNRREWWASSPRFLIVGDSFVTCEHLLTNSLTELFRERIGPAVNIGITGGGPLVELAGLKAHWSKISNSVERIFWCYYEGNDLQDAGSEIGVPLFRNALDPGFRHDPDQSLISLLPAALDAKGHGVAWAVKTVATMQRTRMWYRYWSHDSSGARIVGDAAREAIRFTGKPVVLVRIRRADV